jgi:hypothetical protein
MRYIQYKTLCKIKHPTAQSAIYDTKATAIKDRYVIMALPIFAKKT